MKPKGKILLALLCPGPLSLLVIWLHATSSPHLQFPATLVSPSRPATPFERSLRLAWTLRTRTRLAENRGREALESWDPEATSGEATERLRRLDLARDPSGDLHQARTAAEQAVALARTPTEAYRAVWLLARIDCDLGEHQAELQQARRLMALAPRDRRSREALRRAAVCNGLVQTVRDPSD
jgi:hypothetical protein